MGLQRVRYSRVTERQQKFKIASSTWLRISGFWRRKTPWSHPLFILHGPAPSSQRGRSRALTGSESSALWCGIRSDHDRADTLPRSCLFWSVGICLGTCADEKMIGLKSCPFHLGQLEFLSVLPLYAFSIGSDVFSKICLQPSKFLHFISLCPIQTSTWLSHRLVAQRPQTSKTKQQHQKAPCIKVDSVVSYTLQPHGL